MKPTQAELRRRFENDTLYMNDVKVIVVAVRLPSGVIETITNTQDLTYKAEYYKMAYDEQFRLKANPSIRIVGYMVV